MLKWIQLLLSNFRYFDTQKRFEGTRVTIDTFMAWKAKFDAEIEELNRQKGKKVKTTKGATGELEVEYLHKLHS